MNFKFYEDVRQHYCKYYGLTTVEQIITRWAPPSDGNDTDAYIETVCKAIEYRRDERLPDINIYPLKWCALVRAMAIIEVGEKWASTLSHTDLIVAWHLMQLAIGGKA